LLDYKLEVFTVSADPEAGVAEVAARLSTNRLKVFRTCTEWLAQYRAYRRDKDGDLIDGPDRLMRAMDLHVLSGPQIAVPDAALMEQARNDWAAETRSRLTGY
jgi:hypothetical protein